MSTSMTKGSPLKLMLQFARECETFSVNNVLEGLLW